MTDWQDVRLGDICELKRGYDLPSRSRRPGSVPIVSSSGTTGRHDTSKVRGPGVVTGRYGTLGEVFFLDEDFWPLNTALYVRNFRGNEPRFVYYLLKVANLAGSEGAAAVPGVNRNVLHELPARRPDKESQQRIACVLGAFDELIENNWRRIEILEETARSLYREWFIHYRFPGHDREDLAATTIGQIPRGWTVGPLSEVATCQRFNVMPSRCPDEMFAHFSIPAYDSGQTPLIERGEAIRSGKYQVAEGMVLVSKLNPRIQRVWRVPPVLGNRGVCSTEFVPLVSARPGLAAFIYSLVSSEPFAAALRGMSGGTSTSHQRTKPDDIMALPIVVPTLELMRLFEDRTISSLSLTGSLLSQCEVLVRARDLLLPKLVTGQIEVKSLGVDDVFGWTELAAGLTRAR